MALIQCPECGHTVSDKASFCPNCNYPITIPSTENNKKRNHNAKLSIKAIAAIVMVAVLIGIVLSLTDSTGSKSRKTVSNSYHTQSTDRNSVSAPKTGNEKALASAMSYLNVSAFSYSGLIKQLKYEGFSDSEAKYGADHCGADWNEQALKSAKTYLNVSAFSSSGLAKQLEYEGFTSDQAAYGVNRCGADWNEQAVKSAKSYLRLTDWTRTELIDQLEFEGFSFSQSAYGVDHCGKTW